MTIETSAYIADWNAALPANTDSKSEGDDHIRKIKADVQATLPGFAGRFRRLQTKSGAYTAVLNDNSSILRTSGTWTLSLTAATTLGNGWEVLVYNDGAGTITVDPNGAETINGSATMTVPPGGMSRIYCDGGNFRAQRGTVDSPFPSGTAMVFAQTTAPTGWTKSTTHNDKALRVVSGTASSGGTTAFTTVFGAGKSTGSHTLTIAEIPSHDHRTVATGSNMTLEGGADGATDWRGAGGSAGSPNTGLTGGGGGHLHTLSLDLQYVDVIIATKD